MVITKQDIVKKCPALYCKIPYVLRNYAIILNRFNRISMGKSFDCILPAHQAFIEKQNIFFTGSVPFSAEGYVNISPKGLRSFRVFSPTRVACMGDERDHAGKWAEKKGAAYKMEKNRVSLDSLPTALF